MEFHVTELFACRPLALLDTDSKMCTRENSLDPDVAFDQVLHYLLWQKRYSDKEMHFLFWNNNLWSLNIYNGL